MQSKPNNRFKSFAIGALLAALGAGSYVIAAVTFDEFTSGTTISASAMNAKLNALKDAINASSACPDVKAVDATDRFTDNGDGTVCDGFTGLMWEKKTGTVGDPANLADPHNVNNQYRWSAATEPTGTLFTDFLAKINKGESVSADSLSVTQAGYTDWRIPNVVELRSILIAAPDCPSGPCIDGTFGPTLAFLYWSSSSFSSDPTFAWTMNFFTGGDLARASKILPEPVRAVRGGR